MEFGVTDSTSRLKAIGQRSTVAALTFKHDSDAVPSFSDSDQRGLKVKTSKAELGSLSQTPKLRVIVALKLGNTGFRPIVMGTLEVSLNVELRSGERKKRHGTVHARSHAKLRLKLQLP